MRTVRCIRCGHEIPEGETAVRRRGFTGFYCSFRCLALEAGIAQTAVVSEELVEDDEEAGGYGWES